MIAMAITKKTSVSAIADKIESNENTRFIRTIENMTEGTDLSPALSSPSM
jgi:hypothetical protein